MRDTADQRESRGARPPVKLRTTSRQIAIAEKMWRKGEESARSGLYRRREGQEEKKNEREMKNKDHSNERSQHTQEMDATRKQRVRCRRRNGSAKRARNVLALSHTLSSLSVSASSLTQCSGIQWIPLPLSPPYKVVEYSSPVFPYQCEFCYSQIGPSSGRRK
jgi:hypothetical protein